MKNTRRMKRMSRNRGKVAVLNLTSLMDVFTILVFFLLVNSASTEVLQTPKKITLPASVVEDKPRETVVIFVSPTEVTVQAGKEQLDQFAAVMDYNEKGKIRVRGILEKNPEEFVA